MKDYKIGYLLRTQTLKINMPATCMEPNLLKQTPTSGMVRLK